MEFVSDTIGGEGVTLGADLTSMVSGEHSIPMNFGNGSANVPVNVERDLGKVQVTYEHNNHTYIHVITPQGLMYSSIKFHGDDSTPPKEWQQKGMWRYF